jgi:uncharacterized protein
MVNSTQLISRPRRITEIIFVLLTAAGKFAFMDALFWDCNNCKFPFIAAVIVGWSVYIIARYMTVDGILTYWGFRIDNFKTVLTLPGFFLLALFFVAAMFVLGMVMETLNLKKEIFYLMLLYPIWGFIQQYLLIALVAGNLHDLKEVPKSNERSRNLRIAFITSLLFGGMHIGPYENWYWLAIGTFILSFWYCLIYFKEKNLLVLGLFHGWLGALVFYTVVNRDVWTQVLGPLLQSADVIRWIHITGLAFNLVGVIMMLPKKRKRERWLRVGLALLVFGLYLHGVGLIV